MTAGEEIEGLLELCDDVLSAEEGGTRFFMLKNLRLPSGCTPRVLDALFCPTARDGYNSRLFFAQQVRSPKQLNWNVPCTRILDRNWATFSWRTTTSGLSLIQILANHVGAFR